MEEDRKGEEMEEVKGPAVVLVPEDYKLLNRKFDPRAFDATGTEPIDGSHPIIYSAKAIAGPYSFLDPSKVKANPKMPPPTYLKEDEIAYNMKFTSEDILRGTTQPKEGGLTCSDKEILSKQKGVLTSFLGQAIKGLFQKGGFVRISLPVKVFEGRSTADKIIDAWRMAPTYLTRAAGQTDPVLRMKDIVTFAISGLYCSITQLKPFNPLLGETLEGGMEDGTRVYCEHTSHHPPITTFFVEGTEGKYTMYGRYQYKMQFSANSFKGVQSGPTTIKFHDGHAVKFKMPTVKMSGIVFGTRMVYFVDSMKFYDYANSLKAVVVFDCGMTGGMFSSRKKGCKRDDFEGLLYKWDQSAVKQKDVRKIADLKDVASPVCKITGNWLSHLMFDSEEAWNIERSKPAALWYSPVTLPSDWRYREDLIWLRRNDVPKADFWKVELEVQQRFDRSEREKWQKLRDKKK